MKILYASLFLLLFAFQLNAQNIYVSDTGVDDLSAGSETNPVKTLRGAYDKLLSLYPGKVAQQPVNIYIDGTVNIRNSCRLLVWKVSGTTTAPINITSKSLLNKGTLVNEDDGAYGIIMPNVKYVNITHLTFENATVGISICSSEYCEVKYCIFNCTQITSPPTADGGGGTITLTICDGLNQNASGCVEDYAEKLNAAATAKNNRIIYNKIVGLGYSMVPCSFWLYHSIYIAETEANLIEYNTITKPAGSAIHFYGNKVKNNDVHHNVLEMDYDNVQENNDTCYHLPNRDTVYTRDHARHALWFTLHSSESGFDVANNSETENYLSSSISTTANQAEYASFSPICSEEHIVDKNFLSSSSITCVNGTSFFIDNRSNQHGPNYYFFADNASQTGGKMVKDPFWLNFDSEKLKDKLVTGDFDSDGKQDDILGFYDKGSATELHLWIGKQDKIFDYKGVILPLTSFTTARITGRVVSLDYDNDGITNDVATFYANDDNSVDVSMFKIRKQPNGAFTVSVTDTNHLDGTMTGSQITGKVVSLDFDNDGYRDDIAAIRDNGNGTTNIFVFSSDGADVTYADKVYLSSFTASQITGTTVSGDFDQDGIIDDIAVIYDMGSSAETSRFLSNGSTFSFPTSQPLLTFTASRVKGKTVSGKFDNDSYHDDLALLYNLDNGSSEIYLFTWDNTLSQFQISTAWTGSAYHSDQMGGKLLSWQYEGTPNHSALAAFANYSITGENYKRTRTHVWTMDQGAFKIENNSLGFPWLADNTLEITSGARKHSNSLVTGISTQENEITVYPNPSSGKITISGTQQPVSVEILNDQGTLVLKTKPEGETLNLEGYNAGLYLLKIRTNEKLYIRKVLIH